MYTGCGLYVISTEEVAGPKSACASFGPPWTTCSAPKPPVETALPVPLLRPSPFPPLAMPFPKSALATVPLIPFAPPDPLPCPEPTGMSNEPACAAYSLAPCLPVPCRPLGSPKPPVCTFCTATFTVGATELPEKSPVCRSCGRAPPAVILICGEAKVLITTLGASIVSGVGAR